MAAWRREVDGFIVIKTIKTAINEVLRTILVILSYVKDI
jgi:hypothetical protein